MNITLPPASEQYLKDQVASGRFPTADEVVSEALRRMCEHDQKMDELRLAISIGIDQADQGLSVEFNESTLDRIKSLSRQI